MVLQDLNVHKSKMEVLLGVMTHACHHKSWEAETGGLHVPSRPWQHCKTMLQKNKADQGEIKH